MRKFCSSALLAASLSILAFSCNSSYVFAQENTTVSEEAQNLYEDAIELQKKGKMREAVASYIKALRKDRTVLAFDDNGLIDASYADSVAKLKENPDDIKLLEVCGFLSSVGYSDNKTAITYYEKIVELVTDEGVKERTKNLISRLKATMEAQQAYDSAVIASLRDERIKSWAEMEKVDDFAEEQSKSKARANKLNDAYSDRESLQNKIPQMEEELKELQDSYDKADRLWYTLKDELYERRRRRLKNDLAAKKEELEAAKRELKSVEKKVSSLEKEEEKAQKLQEASAFNANGKKKSEDGEEDEDSVFNSDPSESDDAGSRGLESEEKDYGENSDKNSDDTGNSDSESDEESGEEVKDEYSEEALSKQADEMSDEERQEQLNDLIDNL